MTGRPGAALPTSSTADGPNEAGEGGEGGDRAGPREHSIGRRRHRCCPIARHVAPAHGSSKATAQTAAFLCIGGMASTAGFTAFVPATGPRSMATAYARWPHAPRQRSANRLSTGMSTVSVNNFELAGEDLGEGFRDEA